MQLNLITREDLAAFKAEMLGEIRQLLKPSEALDEWLKSGEACKMLKCSPGTLQNLRINGTLPYTKIGGTLYYSRADVLRVLGANKQNTA
jgi:hypothetical protein